MDEWLSSMNGRTDNVFNMAVSETVVLLGWCRI